MLELGSEEELGHRSLAKPIQDMQATAVYLMGKRVLYLKEELVKNGYPQENIQHFQSPMELGETLVQKAQTGDVILVKGSQGARMEKVVEMLLANPNDKKFLCRQDERWKEIPIKIL